ncbi:MAG: hypothetical protein CVT66_07935 [Actinobacteria bacterium HGW-Actinobacteria-6]|nr:MAG: hypothetical protein CVT66_07935 [Actinobacteria bacterium HGW-Actinobacteria-6]
MNTGTRIAVSAIGGFLVAVLLFGAGHAMVLAHGLASSWRGSVTSVQSSECPVFGQESSDPTGRGRGSRMGYDRNDSSGCCGYGSGYSDLSQRGSCNPGTGRY